MAFKEIRAPKPKAFDRDPKTEAVRLYGLGRSFTDCAQATGLSVGTVRRHCHLAGLASRSRSEGLRLAYAPDPGEEQKVLDLYRSGASSHEIARLTGMAHSGVLNWLKRAGVERRTAKQSHAPDSTLVRQARRLRHRGMAQSGIARTLGINQATVSRWLRRPND